MPVLESKYYISSDCDKINCRQKNESIQHNIKKRLLTCEFRLIKSNSQIGKKKIFLLIVSSYLLVAIFIPVLANAQAPFVRCGNPGQNACTICSVFSTLMYIYNFIVLDIATPLAVISISIGGILMMISAGNPNLLGLGKKILYAAIIGLVLVFCSWLIINIILTTIGYNMGSWWNPNLSC